MTSEGPARVPLRDKLRDTLHRKADLLARDDDRTEMYQMVRLVDVHAIIDEALALKEPSSPASFWAKVDRTSDGCWEWQGTYYPSGYGHANDGKGKQTYAHRRAWMLTYGPIPDGLWVLHHCDNRPCARPDHLFLGTAADNNADRDAKGRGRYGKAS